MKVTQLKAGVDYAMQHDQKWWSEGHAERVTVIDPHYSAPSLLRPGTTLTGVLVRKPSLNERIVPARFLRMRWEDYEARQS